MSDCQYCGQSVEEKYLLCPNCDRQIRCDECGEELVKNKDICYVCLTEVGHDSAKREKNNLTFKEREDNDSYEREIEFNLSDKGLEQGAKVLFSLLESKSRDRLSSWKNDGSVEKKRLTQGSPAESGDRDKKNAPKDADADTTSEESGSEPEPIEEDSTDHKPLQELFIKTEGSLRPRVKDFKGLTKKDQQRRFFALLIWAYQLHQDVDPIDWDGAREAAQKASVYSRANSKSYFDSVVKQYGIPTENGIFLNSAGEKWVEEEILPEIKNDHIQGNEYWRNNSSKPSSSSSSGGHKSSSSKKSKSNGEVQEWVKEDRPSSSFAIKSLDHNYEYVILALHDITSVSDRVSAKPIEIYEFAKGAYRTVPLNKQATRDALISKKGEYFEQSDDGRYYLTSEGEAIASDWIKNNEKTK